MEIRILILFFLLTVIVADVIAFRKFSRGSRGSSRRSSSRGSSGGSRHRSRSNGSSSRDKKHHRHHKYTSTTSIPLDESTITPYWLDPLSKARSSNGLSKPYGIEVSDWLDSPTIARFI
ncbi:uncharacterized protein LOC105254594 isoform X7 [Camponotus floridanus]|uniref:uncharacterized protein LOC105254594 isoform X7 n=1 Tax=Camponotus floridanus TaxID=104421 RepID=UPI000DC68A8A|nr:uncharacterized protein LOC105254594 isoform X7 [Camponotus floridanus]